MDERFFVLAGLPLIYMLFLLILCYWVYPRKWSCTYLGWHDGEGETKHYKKGDVFLVNLSSTCSKCGKPVIQDSQGNWF